MLLSVLPSVRVPTNSRTVIPDDGLSLGMSARKAGRSLDGHKRIGSDRADDSEPSRAEPPKRRSADGGNIRATGRGAARETSSLSSFKLNPSLKGVSGGIHHELPNPALLLCPRVSRETTSMGRAVSQIRKKRQLTGHKVVINEKQRPESRLPKSVFASKRAISRRKPSR